MGIYDEILLVMVSYDRKEKPWGSEGVFLVLHSPLWFRVPSFGLTKFGSLFKTAILINTFESFFCISPDSTFVSVTLLITPPKQPIANHYIVPWVSLSHPECKLFVFLKLLCMFCIHKVFVWTSPINKKYFVIVFVLKGHIWSSSCCCFT